MLKYCHAITLSIILAMFSCQKLDNKFVTTPEISVVENTYDGIKALLTSIYSELPDGLSAIGGNGFAMMASATDEAEYTYEDNSVQNFNTGGWNAAVNPNSVWAGYFKAIRKANYFLSLKKEELDLDRWRLDPDPAKQVVYRQYVDDLVRFNHEARFLRAFFYFELVKRYGGVPLIHQILSYNDDFSKIKRNTLQECIDFIVSECDSSAANLPLTTSTFPYSTANDLGRATKIAALGLKSRVLLYAASELFNNPAWANGYANLELISLPEGDRMSRWKAASDAAKILIDSAKNVTLGQYKGLFNTFNNAEIILFERNAANNRLEQDNSPIGFPLGKSGNTPSLNLVDAYEVKVNSTTSKSFDWSDPQMAANPFSNRDPRLGFSIVVNNSSFGNPSRAVQLWEGGLDGKPIRYASKTGFYLRKYLIENLNLVNSATGIHSWILMRFPEIYLNYAEALNEWNPGHADIKTYYDMTRKRTGVNMPLLPVGLSQEEAREKIRNEKMVEFAFEDHRAWDTRRWMIAPSTLGGPLRALKVTKNGNNYTYTPFVLENRVFTSRMYLYPIPRLDINIGGALIQNPNW